MDVQSLISELQKHPSDMRVLGRGYESGYNNIEDIEVIPVRHVPDNNWYDGEYQDKWDLDEDKDYIFTDCLTLT